MTALATDLGPRLGTCQAGSSRAAGLGTFMMRRLDHEYLMRQSDAPLLKKLPSDYMREMYYTSQPMEITDLELLEGTFRAMDAEHTLMWSSDWPHWDFDLPGRLFQLPFLSDEGRRNILGETARKVFNL
jgi:uncharacterized protein